MEKTHSEIHFFENLKLVTNIVCMTDELLVNFVINYFLYFFYLLFDFLTKVLNINFNIYLLLHLIREF